MNKFISLLCAAFMLCLALNVRLLAQDKTLLPDVSSITIAPAQPQDGDRERLKIMRADGAAVDETSSPVYIVKIYLKQPLPVQNEAINLLFDNQPIIEYGEFKGGIFFKVYTLNDLRKLKGKEIRFKKKQAIKSTNKFMPDVDELPTTQLVKPIEQSGFPSLKEVLEQ